MSHFLPNNTVCFHQSTQLINEELLVNHTSPLGSLWTPHITKKGTMGPTLKSVCVSLEALISCILLILQWLLLLELCWKAKAAGRRSCSKRRATSHLKGLFASKVMPSAFTTLTSILLSATFTRLFSVPSWNEMRAFICHSAAVGENGRKIIWAKKSIRGESDSGFYNVVLPLSPWSVRWTRYPPRPSSLPTRIWSRDRARSWRCCRPSPLFSAPQGSWDWCIPVKTSSPATQNTARDSWIQNTYTAWASKDINHSELYLGKTIRLFLPAVFTAVTKELYHVGKKESPDFHQLRTRRGVLQESGHHLQNHWVEDNISHEEGKMEARGGSRVRLNNARMRGWNCGVFYLLGFWILTVESGSGWGLWTTCVQTCSVRICTDGTGL